MLSIPCTAPRLIIGAVYKQLAEKMKLLWTKDLKMNTVHVRDVVRALWHLKDAGPPGEIYNLVDKGETSEEMNLYSLLNENILFLLSVLQRILLKKQLISFSEHNDW